MDDNLPVSEIPAAFVGDCDMLSDRLELGSEHEHALQTDQHNGFGQGYCSVF